MTDEQRADLVTRLANERDYTAGDVVAGDCPDLGELLTPGAVDIIDARNA